MTEMTEVAEPVDPKSEQELVDGRPILPRKKRAVFHGPGGMDLYDGLEMDMHAIKYGEACVKVEQTRLLKRIKAYRQSMHEGGEGAAVVGTIDGLLMVLQVEIEQSTKPAATPNLA